MSSGKKARTKFEPGSIEEMESHEAYISALLSSPMTWSEWATKLDSPNNGAAKILMDEFRSLSFDLTLFSGEFGEGRLPGPVKAGRYHRIANLLTTWLDARTSIDPSPLLEASRTRAAMGEFGDPVPTGRDVSEPVWKAWEAARDSAEVTLWRANLWLMRKAGEAPEGKGLGTQERISNVILNLMTAGVPIGDITATKVVQLSGCSKVTVVRSAPWRSLMLQRAASRNAAVEAHRSKSGGMSSEDSDDDASDWTSERFN